MSDNVAKPDWEFYCKLVKVRLYEAILLSLDIETSPNRLTPDKDKNVPVTWIIPGVPHYINPMSEPQKDAIKTRCAIVANWLDHPGCFNFIFDTTPTTPMNSYVDLKSFGNWCLKIGLSIPDQFPRDINRSQGHKLNEIFSGANPEQFTADNCTGQHAFLTIHRELPYTTKELEVVFQSMFIVREKNLKTQKDIINIIDEVAKKSIGYKLGKVAVKQLATLITPDEVGENEKRSRKHPSNQKRIPNITA